MIMKKIISFLLIGVMLFSLSACGDSKVKEEEVEEKISLTEVYEKCCDNKVCKLASDGSYITVDTDSLGTGYSIPEQEEKAIESIYNINKELGIPESVVEKMSKTRALDGMQEEAFGDIVVNWTYHPDNGLEVMYELKDNQ